MEGHEPGPVQTGVRRVATQYLGEDLVAEVEAALAAAQSVNNTGAVPKTRNGEEDSSRGETGNTSPNEPSILGPTLSWGEQKELEEAQGAAAIVQEPGNEAATGDAGPRPVEGAAAQGLPFRTIKQASPRRLFDGQPVKEKVKRDIITTGYEIPFRYMSTVP